MQLKDIKLYEKNAKIHTDRQIRALADVVKEIGWRQPVVVNQQGTIVVGHGRWICWDRFKDELPEIWVINDKGQTIAGEADKRPLTPEQERMWRLADNQLNALTGVNLGLAVEELKLLSPEMFKLTGFDKEVLVAPDPRDDEFDDDVPAISAPGDLYEFGGHRVLCGDATKIDDIRKLMGDKKAKMVFTDPPYNVDYQGGMHADGSQTARKKILNDKMSSANFYQFLFDAISGMIKFTEGAFYICMSSSELHNLWKAFTDAGAHWQNYIIWAKDQFTLSRSDYQHQYEPILHGLADPLANKLEQEPEDQEGEEILYGWTKHEWYGGRKQGNVWNYPRPKKSKEHPTMKPVMLVFKAVCNSSRGGI